MRTCTAVIVLLFAWVFAGGAEARQSVPEVGTVPCANLKDDEQDNLMDAADADCSGAAAFSDVGDGFAAEAEDLRRSGMWGTVVDTSASGGDYATFPLGHYPFGGQLAGGGMAADTYHLFLLVQIPANPTSGKVWTAAGTTPLPSPPSNANAALLHGGQEAESWTWVQVGRYGSQDAWNVGVMESSEVELTFATGDLLYLMGLPDLRIDRVYLRPTASAEAPRCPSGGGGPGTIVHYEIQHTPTAPAIGGTVWDSVNVLEWVGYKNQTNPTPTTQILRHGNDLYIRHAVTDTNIAANGCANDASCVTTNDNIFIVLRNMVSTATKDEQTIFVGCDVRDQLYSHSYPSGVVSLAYSASESCEQLFVGDLDTPPAAADDTSYVVMLKFTPGWALANGDQASFNLRSYQRDESLVGYRQTFNTTSGTFTDQTGWGVLAYVDEEVTGGSTPDTTAPTVTSLAFTNIGSTSFTMTAATNEAGTCKRAIDTVNDNAVSDTLLVTVGASSGGTCSANVTGLTASTPYEAKMCVTDAASNTGCTAVGDQATASAGTTFHVKPSGNDTLSGTSEANAWKSVSKGLANMSPGRTLILHDGTYTASTTGLLHIICSGAHSSAPNSPYDPGTSTGRITVRGQNRYGAKFVGASSGVGLPGYLHQCPYWTIENLYFEQGNQSGLSPSPGGEATYTFHVDGSHNYIFRRNLFTHTSNVGSGTIGFAASLLGIHVSEGGLVEENEFYNSSRHLLSLKGLKSGTMRRNYMNDLCAKESDNDNGPKVGFTLYPTQNIIVENNVAQTSPGCGMIGAYNVTASYNANLSHQFPSHNNKFFGNIGIGANNCFSPNELRPNPESDDSIAAIVQGTVIQDLLCVGGTNGVYLLGWVGQTSIIRRVSAFNVSGSGFVLQRKTAWGDTPVYVYTTEDLLSVGHAGTGFFVGPAVDQFSLDGLRVFSATGSNYSARTSGVCTGCTDVVTTNPNLGTKRVYTGLPHGAQITHRYVNGTLGTEKLWVTTPPTGWTGTAYDYYHPACGPIKAGVNDSATQSCAAIGGVLGLTTSNLSGAPGY